MAVDNESGYLVLSKLVPEVEEMFARDPKLAMHLMIRREDPLDAEAYEILKSLMDEARSFRIVVGLTSSFAIDEFLSHRFDTPFRELLDWGNLEESEQHGGLSSKLLDLSLKHHWPRIEGPIVSFGIEGYPEFAIDLSLDGHDESSHLVLEIYSVERRWVGLFENRLILGPLVGTIALTPTSARSKMLGPRPWFYSCPSADAFHYFASKAKASSMPYRVCQQCQTVLHKLDFSYSACDACSGIIH